MLKKDLSNWTNLSNLRGLLYFVQRLDELTFPYSLDSYKAPAMSLQGLIHEIIKICADAEALPKELRQKTLLQVSHIAEEIRFRLKGNFIAKSVSSIPLEVLFRSISDEESLSEVRRTYEVALADLDSHEYFHEVVAAVIALSGSSREKVKLEFLAREFASFLQIRGVSRDYINQTTNDFFFSADQIDNVEKFRGFCQKVYPHQHSFIVVLGVDQVIKKISIDVLERFGIKHLIKEGDILTDEFSKEFVDDFEKFRSARGLRSYAILQVSATDCNSAVIDAKRVLETIHNLFRIFSHKDHPDLSQDALVEQACCDDVRRIVNTPNNSMHHIRDMRRVKASSTLKRFTERMILHSGDDQNKFFNIVNIHGMSLNVDNPDIQLVNIWTCLETLVPSDISGSKISNVMNRLIPVLSLAYFNRLVVNLLFDVIRWDRKKLGSVLAKTNKQTEVDLKSKFIELLALEKNDKVLTELLAEMDDFEVLRTRISDIAIVLRSPKKALDKLKAHEALVRWQLSRIYRARNRIVHAGESHAHNAYLVENAHDYFDQALMFCMELSAWKPNFYRFLTCFDYAEKMYRYYCDQLNSTGSTEVVWQLKRYKDQSIVFGDTQDEP